MKRSIAHILFTATRWVLFAVIVAGLFVVWRFSSREELRLRLAEHILPMMQDPSTPLFEITGLRWPSLRELHAESVRLIDRDGVWLEIHDVQARVGLSGLINQRVMVSTLSAGRTQVHRSPARREAAIRTKKPPSPWLYEVNDIAIARLDVNEGVAGFPVQAAVHASLIYNATTGGTISLSSASLIVFDQAAEVTAEMNWNRTMFAITQLVARTAGGTVTGLGQYDFDVRQATARVMASEMDIAWLSGLAGQTIHGHLSGEANLVYSNRYAGIAWTATARDVTYTNASLRDAQSTGSYEWANREHHIHHSSLSLDGLMIGKHAITPAIIKARTEGHRLLVRTEAGMHHPVEASLLAELEITRTGSVVTVYMPHLEGRAAGKSFTQADASTLRFNTDHWSVAIGLLHWNGTTIKLTAQKNHHLNVQGFVTGLRLDLIPERFRGPIRDGAFDANWKISGFPGRTEGTITWNIHELASVDHPLQHYFPNNVRGAVHLLPEQIRFAAQTHGETNLSVLASADLSYRSLDAAPWIVWDKEVKGMAVVHARLESLTAPYLPDWQQARGEIKASLGVFGSWPKPSLTGNMVIANGFYEDVIRGVTVRDIRLNAGIDSIDACRWTLSASDETQGRLTVTGTYQRIEQSDYVMRAGASLTNFVFGRVFGTDLPIDGTLTLHGTGTTARLSGVVASPPLTIRVPRQLPPSIRSLRVVDIHAVAPAERAAGNPRGPPFAIETDIRIQANRGLRVQGNQLRSDWRGNGHITGVIPDLRLGGSVNLVRGSFMFLGRRFTVTRGEILIPSGVRVVAPTVFITAETRAGGADITLRIEGSSESPTLSLSSSPPMENNEIVARLLFGRSGDSVSPFQIAYLAYALDILEGGGPLLQQLDNGQRTLGLDQLDIKQSEEDSGFSAVVVGKRVTDRLFFEGEVGLQNKPDVFAVEAELAPNIILRTETSPRIREGISIYWRRDY